MSLITLTESAQTQINTLCKENNCYALSLDVAGGGCAGFTYEWNLVKEKADIEEGSEVIDAGEHSLVVNRSSIFYLLGSEVDYIRSLTGSQFDIRNPNAQNSCGCGVSVNFDLDTIPQFIE